jgi:hypothetical protein
VRATPVLLLSTRDIAVRLKEDPWVIRRLLDRLAARVGLKVYLFGPNRAVTEEQLPTIVEHLAKHRVRWPQGRHRPGRRFPTRAK